MGKDCKIWWRWREAQHRDGRRGAHVGVKRRVAGTKSVVWPAQERQSRRKSTKCTTLEHACHKKEPGKEPCEDQAVCVYGKCVRCVCGAPAS